MSDIKIYSHPSGYSIYERKTRDEKGNLFTVYVVKDPSGKEVNFFSSKADAENFLQDLLKELSPSSRYLIEYL